MIDLSLLLDMAMYQELANQTTEIKIPANSDRN